MTALRALARSALCLAMIAAILISPGVSPAGSTQNKLRKEKARLTEMRKRAKKAEAELNKALKRERAARHKVDGIRKRINVQRRLIARIDRKLSELAREMKKVESEMRAVEKERGRTRNRLERATTLAFLEKRGAAGLTPVEARGERLRYFARLVLASEAERYSDLSADKEEKENALSGIERKVELSEKRISREKKVGRSLLSQQKAEAARLAKIKKQKTSKEKELKALRSRVARMKALVSRIEREVREAERRRSRGRRGKGPSKFSRVPGGLVAPVRGKVVGAFGKYQDPVFNVEVENHGVEIEASSGSPIRSIGRGKVVFSGTVSGFGKVLIIQHGTGLFSVYGKAESFRVAQGQVVAPGQNIGHLPESPGGKSMLYLELRAGGTATMAFYEIQGGSS
jgi:septal ring factor EnvC (AmiA/AmiB activator)